MVLVEQIVLQNYGEICKFFYFQHHVICVNLTISSDSKTCTLQIFTIALSPFTVQPHQNQRLYPTPTKYSINVSRMKQSTLIVFIGRNKIRLDSSLDRVTVHHTNAIWIASFIKDNFLSLARLNIDL